MQLAEYSASPLGTPLQLKANNHTPELRTSSSRILLARITPCGREEADGSESGHLNDTVYIGLSWTFASRSMPVQVQNGNLKGDCGCQGD